MLSCSVINVQALCVNLLIGWCSRPSSCHTCASANLYARPTLILSAVETVSPHTRGEDQPKSEHISTWFQTNIGIDFNNLLYFLIDIYINIINYTFHINNQCIIFTYILFHLHSHPKCAQYPLLQVGLHTFKFLERRHLAECGT